MNKNKVKSLLVHYFEMAIGELSSDNVSEIEDIIEFIYDEIEKSKCNECKK